MRFWMIAKPLSMGEKQGLNNLKKIISIVSNKGCNRLHPKLIRLATVAC